MSLRSVLVWLRSIIIVLAGLSTTYLYLYPVVFGCAFPSTTGSTHDGFKNTVAQHRGQLDDHDPSLAPFRLLVLADPQLEGDSSLPSPEDALFARIGVHWRRLRKSLQHDLKGEFVEVVKELAYEDISRSFSAARKTLDLFGNDYYLAHIYRTLHWWTNPTHVTVLGDLIGSQWVSDDEFEWRGWRYWNRVFAGSQKVDEEIMSMHAQDEENQHKFALDTESSEDWSRKIINIAGNHDIGYAGDISRSRLKRFESTFGRANWDVKFSYPCERVPEARKGTGAPNPEIHLIVLNSMLLDTPVLDQNLQGDTYTHINDLITQRLDPVESRNTTFTLLLTHVPLHKPASVCVDAPFFDFWDFEDADGAFKNGGLREQNHLSEHTSHEGILRAIYGMSGDGDAPVGGKGRNGLILNGHDHEGCDVVHYIERTVVPATTIEGRGEEAQAGEEGAQASDSSLSMDSASQPESSSSWSWKSVRHSAFASRDADVESSQIEREIVTSLREITLRSMMGSYSGNAGLLSLWYDFDAGNWDYSIVMCPLGVQHTWWAIHVIDIIAILLMLGQLGTWLYEHTSGISIKTRSETPTTVGDKNLVMSGEAAKQGITMEHISSGTVIGEKRSSSTRRKG
ncbi:hypothetical protein OHC33_001056 [Knufia fluminis]|uniref:Uncharacterized protein n=1 Tax=Knufia fluminis TaxID=191047 RepID=A0AAN8ESN2_9EURO|nr:hypothetical protein OHC33_001056 [Knufia fluminis]